MKNKIIDILHTLLIASNLPEEQIKQISDSLIDSTTKLIDAEFKNCFLIKQGADIKSLKNIKTELFEIDSICKISADNIIKSSNTLNDLLHSLEDETTRKKLRDIIAEILTSCEFQDLVNQRMDKIDKLMHQMREELSNVFVQIMDPSSNSVASNTKDNNLMNGPQSSDVALTQTDIDKILKG